MRPSQRVVFPLNCFLRGLSILYSMSENSSLLDCSEVLSVVQNIPGTLSPFHRAERTHTSSYLLSDIISHTLGFELPISTVKFCPLYFSFSSGETKKEMV